MATCPECGNKIPDNATYCPLCGATVTPKKTPQKTTAPATSTGSINTGIDLWVILVLIMMVVGGFLSFWPGFWIVGLPLIIASGVIAGSRPATSSLGKILKTFLPRVSAIIFFLSVRMITIIPFYQEVSVFGLPIAFMALVLTAPLTKEGEQTRFYVVSFGIIGIIATIMWSLFNFGIGTQGLWVILMMAPLVGASIFWRLPFSPGVKLAATIAGFGFLIFVGVNFLLTAGGALLGGFFDQMQNLLAGQDIGLSGTVLDTILNPQLAVQAGLQPPTTKEVTRSGEQRPMISFEVSGRAIPESGCYDSTTFQVIGEVENVGGEFINDLRMRMTPKPSPELIGSDDTTCQDITFSEEGGCTASQGEWRINSIPKNVKVSRSCLIDSVKAPEPVGADLEEGESANVSPTHTCYINVTATTGFHSTTRLPVEFIEADYGRSKFEQGQLVQEEVPGTSSTGPVDFSLGGFEQPILYYGAQATGENRVTMLTTFSAVGDVAEYVSAYLYIPSVLLENSQCVGGPENNDWECLNRGDLFETDNWVLTETKCDNSLSDEDAQRYCRNFNEFKDTGIIGGFSQFNYDNSFNLIKGSEDYYVLCFYTEPIDTQSIIETGKCTLRIGEVMSDQLRKTVLLRGDVLYTYNVRGEVGITIQDCEV